MDKSSSSRMLSEADAIAMLHGALQPGAPPRGIRLGIGDDAAILARPGTQLVWTVDASVEGAHFDLNWLGLEEVGWRSFQAAVSDIAAMGATPLAALSSIAFPGRTSERELESFARGQAEAARSCRCPVVGGNIARSRHWQISTTVLGTATTPLRRDLAEVGDELWLLGRVGLAAAGLKLLRGQQGKRAQNDGAMLECIEAWRRPEARLVDGQRLRRRAHAAMDVSDGLRADLPKLARASRVQIVLCEEALARSLDPALIAVAGLVGVSALELAIGGGEDYALVATGPAKCRPAGAAVIGAVARGSGAVLEREGTVVEALEGGFDHFG